ncbi:mannose/fructose/sorbose-specific PTS system IIA component [Ligilactobacillus salitolerans]|uniref:Mannose/fructose/sorbose-specific PTS system IIA component n=1 Tax=Ligilactobacillus salitolerans TaxID=1808352 RepID=A0A401IVD2_9LACO|nr:PTS fructose transporter subunit IIA [Ligilactobacillus salitolerans]GBG95447.1 mannose/fructose/sorbose-specific PTS system IIA component [Ligilactobacillus salitolerans]
MKTIILLSHGEFAPGLKSALEMFAGDQAKDVLAFGLRKGESADQFGQRFAQGMAEVDQSTGLVLLADIIGGSPLTTACNILAQAGRMEDTIVLGGMNFPMALNAVLYQDSLDGPQFVEKVLGEASAALQQFNFQTDTDDEEDDI